MMTFRFAKCAVAIGAIGLAGVLQSSAQAATGTATANATIATAIGISSPTALNFGIMVPDPGLVGTVVVDPAGARSAPGGIVTLVGGGTIGAAVFDVTGQTLAVYSIDLPADGVVTLAGAGPAMAVDGFNDSLGGTDAAPANGTLGTDDSFTVGATLTVGIGQAVGTYTGTFDVIVLYN